MTGADAAQGLARGINVFGAMSIFGSALFETLVAAQPAIASDQDARRLQKRISLLVWLSLAAVSLSTFAWLGCQAAVFADGDSLADLLSAVPTILFDTHFGTLIGVRIALLIPACLIVAGVIPRNRATLSFAAVVGGLAVGLQLLLGHGISMQGTMRVTLITSEGLHVLAAGAWLGGLAPLVVLVAGLPPANSMPFVRRFSLLGTLCVAVLAITSLLQAWMLVGGLPGLIGTDYGRLAAAKLILFLALLLLAALNRSRWPGLAGQNGEATRRHLLFSISIETAVGLGVVVLAGMLLMLSPGTRQQPVWPFQEALSLSILEQPIIAPRLAVAGMAAGLFLGAVAAVWRKGRISIGMAGAVAFLGGISQAGSLLVPAHPTSFFHSPTGFTASSIVQGGRLFAANYAGCDAGAIAERYGTERDGDLFWLLSGSDRPACMPRLGQKLGADDLWAIIDYLKARSFSDRGGEALQAPDLPVRVAGHILPLVRLRGEALRLVAAGESDEVEPVAGVTTLRIDPDSDGWSAYATIAHVPQPALRQFTFLVDGDGRLRGIFPPKPDGRSDDAAFNSALAAAAH
jgi:putative copper export protein